MQVIGNRQRLQVIRQTCWASEMAWAVAAAALLGGAMWAASTAASVTGALATVVLLFIFIFLLLLFEVFLGRFLIGVKSLEDRNFFSFSSGGPAADLVWTDIQMCSLGKGLSFYHKVFLGNTFLEYLCLESFHLVLMLSATLLLAILDRSLSVHCHHPALKHLNRIKSCHQH